MLVKYVRNKSNQPVGVVVAVSNPDGGFLLGWSKCRPFDRFNKSFGKMIAQGRALMRSNVAVPEQLVPALEVMSERASRYFK